jgi:hypothetical protein
MKIIEDLAAVHVAISQSSEPISLEPTELDDEDREQGWVPTPLSTEDIVRLEGIAGFSFSPLLRALFTTKNAIPPVSGGGVFGIGEWVGSAVFVKNAEVAKAREEYDWDLPKLVAITSDEDFVAVTEDHRVVRICSNEANIEVDHGPLEGWIARYIKAGLSRAADPDDEDAFGEDPEQEFP